MRKNRLLAVLLAAVMLAAVIPFSVNAASAVSSMKIVAFGDSITHFGATNTGNTDPWGNRIYSDAYPDYLGSKLGVQIVNAGVGGNTTDMAYNRLWSEVINEKPNLVIICFGMNDQAHHTSTNGSSMTPIEPYKANLEKFIYEINKAGGEVLLMTPHPVCTAAGYFPTTVTEPNYNYGYLDEYCNAMREVAIKTGCGYVDMYAEFSALGDNAKNYMAVNDGVHQNDAGRRLYADIIAEHLYAVYDGTNKATMTIRCQDENGKILVEYQLVGASGAAVTVPSPELPAYTEITDDITTTYVNGAVHTFTYSSDIEDLVAKAGKVKASEYNASVLRQLQMAYSEAMNEHFAATPNFDNLESYATLISNLLNAKGESELLLSSGCSYTTTAPNYYQWDSSTNSNSDYLNLPYADDGVRLTDGNKLEGNGGCSAYSAWTSNMDVTIDLGKNTEADIFRGYFAYGDWGVGKPTGISVSYLDSEGQWAKLQGTVSFKTLRTDTGNGNSSDNIWGVDQITFTAENPVAARYFKISVQKLGSFVWASEFEVALKVSPTPISEYEIDGANTRVTNGSTNIFTPGFKVSGDSANLNWTANVKANWDPDKNAYIVTKVFTNQGTTAEETLGAGEIILAAHAGDESNNNAEIYNLIVNASLGQALYFNGVDMGNGVAIGATFELFDYNDGSDIIPDNEHNIALNKPHTQNGFSVADGMWPANYTAKLTDGKAAASLDYRYHDQWFGISMFADDDGIANADENGNCEIIVSLGDFYSIDRIRVNTFVGNQDGIAAPAAILAYVSDTEDGDYTFAGELVCGNVANKVAWMSADCDVKGKFVKIIVKISRYNDGTPYTYAFINEIEVYGDLLISDDDPNPDPVTGIKGDVNGNGKIDARDYLLLKRAYFGTYTLTCADAIADINGNNKLDARDYLLLKRAYFGTYTIQ